MTNESTGGVSKRSLILLGAFAALALNRDLRRNLILGTRDAIDTAQNTLNDTVKPALSNAAQQAQHAANVAAHQAQHAASVAAQQAGDTWETLREDGPARAQTLLGTAQEVVGTLAATAAERAAQLRKDAEAAAEQARKEYGPKLGDLQENLLEATDEQRYQARKALKKAQKRGMVALADLGDKASALRESAIETVDDNRADAMRALARARKDAEKELRAQRKKWNPKKLERAIEKRVSPVQKQVQREFVRLEKEAGRKGSQLQARLKPEPKRTGMSSGLTTVVLLGTGAVVLARVPAVRQGILSAVEAVSPDAAQKLHQASRQARNLLGDMWLEDMEKAAPPAAGAAKSTQAATTGASAAAAVEPGSSAASTPKVEGDNKDNAHKDNAPKN